MNKDILKDLVDKGLSQRLICAELKCSQTSVRHWLSKYGLATSPNREYKCSCGEADLDKFYGTKKSVCGNCHNKYTVRKGHEKRAYALTKLGNECVSCGFDKYPCSLDIHHLDPSIKDDNFGSMRGWSLARIDSEIESCILLCKNCHAAHHSGLLEITPE